MLFRKSKTIVMSEKEFNAKVNGAYLEGYSSGYSAGEKSGLMKRYSPNQLRAIFDLPPIHDGKKADFVTCDDIKSFSGIEIVIETRPKYQFEELRGVKKF